MSGSARARMLALAVGAMLLASPLLRSTIAQQPQFINEEVRHLPPVDSPSVLPGCVRRLTLDEARQLALENNKALVLAQLNVHEKQHATTAATKDYFPKVLGSVTYFHFDNPLGTVLTTRGTILPTTVPVNVVNQDATLSTAFIAQPITKLIAVNALVQIDRADEHIAKAKLDKGAKDVLSDVTQIYYGLLARSKSRLRLVFKRRCWNKPLRPSRPRSCESTSWKCVRVWYRFKGKCRDSPMS